MKKVFLGLQNLSKRKKIIIASTITLVVLTIIVCTVLVLAFKGSQKSSTDSQTNDSNQENAIINPVITSYPMSYFNYENRGEQITIKEPEQVVLATDYEFSNPELVAIKKDSIFSTECYPTSYPPQSEITLFRDSSSNFYNYVNNNMSKYKIDDSYNQAYKELQLLFKDPDEMNVYIDKLAQGFYRPCSGEASPRTLMIKEFIYPKIEKAYYIVSYAGGQSIATVEYMPLYLTFISKIDDSYSFATTAYNYEDLAKSNSLTHCSGLAGEEYPYIDWTKATPQECVINSLNADLDQTKMDQVIQNFITTFELR